VITGLLAPVLPESCAKIWAQLGFATSCEAIATSDLHWGHLKAGQKLGVVSSLFPRADAKASIAKMIELESEEVTRQLRLLGQAPKAEEKKSSSAPAAGDGLISIDDFVKVDLRAGIVKDAAPVKGADKLLHLHVDIGEAEPRSIVAGIALAYKPEELVGRKVVIVANLAPRKLKGLTSQGMIVAASREGDLPVLATFQEDVPPGARLK